MGNLVRRYKCHQIEPCLTQEEIYLIDYIKGEIFNVKPYIKKHNNIKYQDIIFYLDINDKILFEFIIDEFILYKGETPKVFRLSEYFLNKITLIYDYENNFEDFKAIVYLLSTKYLKLEIDLVWTSSNTDRYLNIENEYSNQG